MNRAISNAELILNEDGSIYHLAVPQINIGSKIITVGDPDRVNAVLKFADRILERYQCREFHTAVAEFKGEMITVISTGIGTDNIDIVINELDALTNIDFATRQPKNDISSLQIVRLGTSGLISDRHELGDVVTTDLSYGFDCLGHFYGAEEVQLDIPKWRCYRTHASKALLEHFDLPKSCTATMPGFYAPQGRHLRGGSSEESIVKLLSKMHVDNLEMETSGIYCLSKLLGHQALSVSVLLADRTTGKFHPNPKKAINNMIEMSLKKIISL